MPLTRQQKEARVADMEQNLSDATSAVFIAFDGLTMPEVTELRIKLHEGGSRMRVVPKTLLRLALKQAGLEFNPQEHSGQIAVVWGNDAVAPAKAVHDFAKTHEHVRLVAGVLEKDLLSLDQVKSLAQLPTREQLLGQLVSVLAGPTRGFVTVLSGVPRSLVYALQALKEQKEKAA